jgi:hypothetical protein
MEEFPQPIVDPNDNTNLMCPICRRSTKTKQRYQNLKALLILVA